MCIIKNNFFLGYYGISMVSAKLGSNASVSTIAAALTEIPAYLFCMVAMDRLGRKPICWFAFTLTGISCLPAGFTHGSLQLALALIGTIRAYTNKMNGNNNPLLILLSPSDILQSFLQVNLAHLRPLLWYFFIRLSFIQQKFAELR